MGVSSCVMRDRLFSSAKLLCKTSLALLAACLVPHAAAAGGRHAAIIMDANTGAILHDSEGSEHRYPASLTKMMTLYLAFEEIESGRMSYTTRITFSPHAAAAAPTKLGLDAGEDIAVIDAIKALVTKSANDVAIALAEHIGGTEDRFAEMMTEKAKLLGMRNTTFENASGLPAAGQVTTARDMVTLALRLQDDFPKHYPLFGIRSFTYRGQTYSTHNGLLRSFEGTDGIKTGYTRLSGYNLVSSVKRGGRHVIGAVFGGSSASSRDAEMRMLISRALFKASAVKTRKPAPLVMTARTGTPRPATGRSAPSPFAERPIESAQVTDPTQAGSAKTGDAAVAAMQENSVPLNLSIAKVKPVSVVPAPRTDGGSALAPAAVAMDAPAVPPQLVGPPMPAIRRGTGPSSLQQQAQNLAAGREPVERPPVIGFASDPRTQAIAYSGQSAGAQVSPAPTGSGPYLIQVGAFGSAVEAEKALSTTLERASSLLATAAPVTAAVNKGSKQLFRARFSGFDAQTAATACFELRRRQIECLVMRAE